MANSNQYYNKPFADSGTKQDVPDQSVGGNVSFETGYGSDYELAQGDPNRKRIPRGAHNELLNGVTKNIKQQQENNYPTWIEDALNNATVNPFAYKRGKVVNHSGADWVSLSDGNTEEPSATAKNWAPFNGVSFQVDPLTTINGFFRSGMVPASGVPIPTNATFAANAKIAFDWKAGVAGVAGVTVNDNGILFSASNAAHSIVTEVQLGAGTTITSPDQLTLYLIDNNDVTHYIKDGENSVAISVAAGVAKFEIKSGIFASLSITSIKQAFGMFQVGAVREKSENDVLNDMQTKLLKARNWVDVSGSRAFNVPETNNTSSAIDVSIQRDNANNVTFECLLDGTSVAWELSTSDYDNGADAYFSVPSGSTYVCNSNGTLRNWNENRI
jgi:hypothetical protein